MSGCSYVERRGSRYYFRTRIPLDLAVVTGRTHVVASLGTSDQRIAKIKSARFFFLLASFFATMHAKMDHVLDFDGRELSRRDMLAAGAFELGQEYESRKGDLKKEFTERLRQLVASLSTDMKDAGKPFDHYGSLDRMESLVEISERVMASSVKTFVMQQSSPPAPPISSPWIDLTKEFFDDKPGLSSKTLWSYKQAFEIWAALIGRKPIREIQRADLKTFADYLRDKPNPRGGQLHYKSIERSLGHIRNFMLWAVEAGLVEDDRFGDVKGRDKTREERLSGDNRRAFTEAELKRLFDSPIFQTPADEAERAAAWFLAIAALTGARTEEITEAPAALVKVGEVWCLDLRKSGTKTRAAPRLVPLLNDLIRLGLLDWAARQADLGRQLVQPGPQARTTGAWSKYLNRYINKSVETSSNVVLYSLRHNFRQMLRAANVGDELANKVFGHEVGSVGAGYGKDLSAHEAALVFRTVKSPIDLGYLRAWS